MSYLSHDALRQYLGITGVSPVGTIRDCRIPIPSPHAAPGANHPFAPFFLLCGKFQSMPRAAMETGSAWPITK
jgi:hypothetical protein